MKNKYKRDDFDGDSPYVYSTRGKALIRLSEGLRYLLEMYPKIEFWEVREVMEQLYTIEQNKRKSSKG